MFVTLRDISQKRKGVMTYILIDRKTIEVEFTYYLSKYKEFIWQPPSSRNYKYIARMRVVEAEKKLFKVVDEYRSQKLINEKFY